MNFIKTTFLTCSLLATISLTSCMGDDNSNSGQMQTYCTIDSTMEPNYNIWMDGGGLAHPTALSVQQVTGGKGLSGMRRALVTFSYTGEDIEKREDMPIVNNAQLLNVVPIPVVRPITLSEAESTKQTLPDSCFTITQVKDAWAYKGYITAVTTVQYYKKGDKVITPTLNLVYDPAECSGSEFKMKLMLNCHDSKSATPAGVATLAISYPTYYLAHLATGSDKIIVTVEHDNGIAPKTFYMTREDFKEPIYTGGY